MRVFFTLILCFLWPATSYLQSEIAFIAYTDADGVIPGQPFEVTFELKNTNVRSFEPPDFGSLDVIRGPSVTNSMQIINGQRSSSRAYTFALSAPKAGRFAIPPATAKTDNGVLRSNALEIQIKSLPEGKRRVGEDIILEIVPSDSQVFVGEQITVDYILYFQESVERIYTANELDFSGFYKEKINQYPRTTQKTSLGGNAYAKKIIQRDIIFGQQSGTYTLGPLFCEVEVLDDKDPSPFSFFRNTVRKEVVANPVTIEVVPLPESLPQNFSGGVGQYEMEVQIKDPQISIGEAAEILVKIEGDGDPNILDAPILITGDNAKVFEPQLIYESKNEKQGRLNFIRSWNFLVVPETEGSLSLYSKFIYLDSERNKLDTLISQNVEIWAKPASAGRQAEITEGGGNTNSESGSNFWVYLIAGGLLLGFATALFIRFWTPRKRSNNTIRQIEQLIRLTKEEKQATDPDLSKIKRGIQDVLQDSHFPSSSVPNLESLIKEIERVQFSKDKERGEIFDLLKEIISELRKAHSELD